MASQSGSGLPPLTAYQPSFHPSLGSQRGGSFGGADSPVAHAASEVKGLSPHSSPPSQSSSQIRKKVVPLPNPATQFAAEKTLPIEFSRFQLPALEELFSEWAFRSSLKETDLDGLLSGIQGWIRSQRHASTPSNRLQLEGLVRDYLIAELQMEQLESELKAISEHFCSIEQSQLEEIKLEDITQLDRYRKKKLLLILAKRITSLERALAAERPEYARLSDRRQEQQRALDTLQTQARQSSPRKQNPVDGTKLQQAEQALTTAKAHYEESSKKMDACARNISSLSQVKKTLEQQLEEERKTSCRQAFRDLVPAIKGITQNITILQNYV